MPIVWTDDLKEQIKSLWETNSASAIAVQLQSEGWAVSRNSVVGALHRMGLTALNKTETHPSANKAGGGRPRKPRPPRVPRPPKLKVYIGGYDLFSKARIDESFLGSVNVHGFDDLEPHHCRYIVNDDTSDPLWCGRVSLSGKSWCASHAALVFLPREQRRAAA
jgi:hypothetical protein